MRVVVWQKLRKTIFISVCVSSSTLFSYHCCHLCAKSVPKPGDAVYPLLKRIKPSSIARRFLASSCLQHVRGQLPWIFFHVQHSAHLVQPIKGWHSGWHSGNICTSRMQEIVSPSFQFTVEYQVRTKRFSLINRYI
eukprot:SAG31_NODE_3453_length_4253_cov_2.708233_4_plen_136_part_00